MTWLSLGSLALPYQLQRQGVALRSEITRLGVELTTGQTANPQQHLRGDGVGHLVLDDRAEEDDPLLEQPAVDVHRPLFAAALLDDIRNE